GADHGFGARIGCGIAACHHRELAVLCTRLTAGNGSIDEVKAALLRLRRQLARDFGGGGGVVDEHHAGTCRGEGAVGTGAHVAQVVVVTDAQEYEVLPFCRGGRRRGGVSAVFLLPC